MFVAKNHGRRLGGLVAVTVACMFMSAAFADEGAFVEGFSQPYRTAEVAAASAGILEKWLVVEGQSVKSGQTLVTLDSSVHEAMLRIAEQAMRAEGELASAEAEHKLRQQRLEALRELANRQHATQDELRQAVTEADLAEAKLRTAQENRLLRELEHEKLAVQATSYQVRAPFDGVVTTFHKQAGEYVGPADPVVCTIVELTTLSVKFLVPREQRGGLEVGREATVWFGETGREATGTIYYVSPFPDGETNTYLVKVRVCNSDLLLTAGERCRLTLCGVHSETDSDGTNHQSALTETPTATDATSNVSAPAQSAPGPVRPAFGMWTSPNAP